jgi:SRSO17 transposase
VWLEQQEVYHVLAIKSNEPLWAGPRQVGAARLAAQVSPEEWDRLSAGEGAKGPRYYDWVRVPIRPLGAPGKGYWLLVRRSIAQPEELAYYVCFGPAQTTLAELVEVAGTRWAIEEGFQAAKGQVGLDQYEVRRWVGWYRHITLVLLAHAFLAVTRYQAAAEPSTQKGAV